MVSSQRVFCSKVSERWVHDTYKQYTCCGRIITAYYRDNLRIVCSYKPGCRPHWSAIEVACQESLDYVWKIPCEPALHRATAFTPNCVDCLDSSSYNLATLDQIDL